MRSLADGLAARGHRLVVLAPSRSPELVRESRRLIRAGEFFDPDGERARARRRRAAAARAVAARDRAGAAARRRPHARRRPPQRAARLRPRPRAVRAEHVVRRPAPLARAQRGHVPRAGRARDLDPGRAPLRRALLRAARRAHGLLRGDARADGARVPRPLPGARGPAPSRAPPRPRAATARCGSPSSTTRTARRCGCSCARCGGCPPGPHWRATVFTPSGRAHERRCAAGCAERVEVVTAEDGERAGGARGAPTSSSPRRPARRRRPGCWCARSARARSPSRASCPPTARSCATASAGCCSASADVDVLAAQLERLLADDGAARAGSPAPSPPPRPSWPGTPSPGASRRSTREVAARRHPPRADGARARAARRAARDRRRPAHAHRPLVGLRDAGRGAARDRARRRGSARSR